MSISEYDTEIIFKLRFSWNSDLGTCSWIYSIQSSLRSAISTVPDLKECTSQWLLK